jgi:hypothetical protein
MPQAGNGLGFFVSEIRETSRIQLRTTNKHALIALDVGR